jgi:hypothetical protein
MYFQLELKNGENKTYLSFKDPLPDLPPKGKEIFSPLGDPDSYRERKGVKIYETMFNS